MGLSWPEQPSKNATFSKHNSLYFPGKFLATFLNVIAYFKSIIEVIQTFKKAGLNKMALRSIDQCMHAAQFCSGFFFFQPKLLCLLCYEDDSFTILLPFHQGSAVSHWISEKWKVHNRDSCGTSEIGLLFGHHFALHI